MSANDRFMVYKKMILMGRPNVGKSTLFNRLAGKKLAIVEDIPGVTRDWREAEASLGDLKFCLIDTAGLDGFEEKNLAHQIQIQTEKLLKTVEGVLFMVDAREGLVASDRIIAARLHTLSQPCIVLANKADTRQGQENISDFYDLGLGEPIALSASQGTGFIELYEELRLIFKTDFTKAAGIPLLSSGPFPDNEKGPKKKTQNPHSSPPHPSTSCEIQKPPSELLGGLSSHTLGSPEEDSPLLVREASFGANSKVPADGRAFSLTKTTKNQDSVAQDPPLKSQEGSQPLRLAIVGRPNMGKSTLMNQLIGEERLLTGDQPGTTRDAIDIEWEYREQALCLVDTAGVRRRSKVTDVLEKAALQSTFQAIRYAHMVVLVLDARTPLDKQDLVLASHILDEGRGLILAFNKWDQLKTPILSEVQKRLQSELSQVKDIPCIPISALTGYNLEHLMDTILKLYERWQTRLPTAPLNSWLQQIIIHHPPPIRGTRRLKIKYMTQIKTRPPTFVLFMSKPEEMPLAYLRFLENRLRQDFNLPGVPLRLYTRASKNPWSPRLQSSVKEKPRQPRQRRKE